MRYNGEIFYPEVTLSRIINPDSAGKERTRLTKAVVLAIRELAQQSGPGDDSRDLAAFISLALSVIAATIEVSVAAWEKRDYWAGQYAEKMRRAVFAEDWAAIAQIATQTAQKLNKIVVAPRHRLGRPWVGAWEELKKR